MDPLPQDGGLHSLPCIRRHREKVAAALPTVLIALVAAAPSAKADGMLWWLDPPVSALQPASHWCQCCCLGSCLNEGEEKRGTWAPTSHGLTLTCSASYCQQVLQNSPWNSFWVRDSLSWVATAAAWKPVWSNPLRWKTRGEILPMLPLCTLPARTKSKEPQPRELCLGDLTF